MPSYLAESESSSCSVVSNSTEELNSHSTAQPQQQQLTHSTTRGGRDDEDEVTEELSEEENSILNCIQETTYHLDGVEVMNGITSSSPRQPRARLEWDDVHSQAKLSVYLMNKQLNGDYVLAALRIHDQEN